MYWTQALSVVCEVALNLRLVNKSFDPVGEQFWIQCWREHLSCNARLFVAYRLVRMCRRGTCHVGDPSLDTSSAMMYQSNPYNPAAEAPSSGHCNSTKG